MTKKSKVKKHPQGAKKSETFAAAFIRRTLPSRDRNEALAFSMESVFCALNSEVLSETVERSKDTLGGTTDSFAIRPNFKGE